MYIKVLSCDSIITLPVLVGTALFPIVEGKLLILFAAGNTVCDVSPRTGNFDLNKLKSGNFNLKELYLYSYST